MAGRLILGISYGYRVKDANDSFLALVSGVTRLTGEGLKSKYLVFSEIPACMFIFLLIGVRYTMTWWPVVRNIPSWFPGGQFRILANEARNATKHLIEQGFGIAKDLMVSCTTLE
jgi:hypothetical protein